MYYNISNLLSNLFILLLIQYINIRLYTTTTYIYIDNYYGITTIVIIRFNKVNYLYCISIIRS